MANISELATTKYHCSWSSDTIEHGINVLVATGSLVVFILNRYVVEIDSILATATSEATNVALLGRRMHGQYEGYGAILSDFRWSSPTCLKNEN